MTLCIGVGCTRCSIRLSVCKCDHCVQNINKRRDPREGMSGGREIPVLMKTSHTTLSASSSSSSSHMHSEKDQADGWSCVSVMAAGMALTEGLHT